MATKTIVCPECGSPTAPGRYTCGECGAFLDGLAVAPRSWSAEPASEPASEPGVGSGIAPAARPAEAEPEPAALAVADLLPEAGDPLLSDGPSLEPVDPTLPPPPDVLHDVQWPAPEDRLAGAAAPVAAAPEPLTPRVPAGAYLPPSALLTGLDETAVSGAGAAVPGPAPAPRPAAPATAPRDWLAALGSAEARRSASRRTIAIGSAVAVIAFVLPWASGSADTLFNVWTQVWGLAGAGHWLIVLAVAALGALAASSGRAEAVPLAIPAIALAALLLGLSWPHLLGAASRPIGVLVVFVGLVVLAAGGILGLDGRHEAATPDV